MQRIKVKESYRLDAEALKYDLVITNKQSNLITKVKGASRRRKSERGSKKIKRGLILFCCEEKVTLVFVYICCAM